MAAATTGVLINLGNGVELIAYHPKMKFRYAGQVRIRCTSEKGVLYSDLIDKKTAEKLLRFLWEEFEL